jgi:hypothetical protein
MVDMSRRLITVKLRREGPARCQILSVPGMSEGLEETGPHSFTKRVKMVLKRTLGTRLKRSLKEFTVSLGNRPSPAVPRDEIPGIGAAVDSDLGLQAGDRVRVRPIEEIRATLDMWSESRHCAFFPEMEPYCGTVQTVLKPVRRFVDERDYRVKRATGVVLLKDLICQGTSDYGECDRACFFFWREEWLERVE